MHFTEVIAKCFLPPAVAFRLLGLAGGQMGHLETFGCFFTYFVVMGENGFLPLTLIGIRATWDNSAINNLEDSYGQEWVRFVCIRCSFNPAVAQISYVPLQIGSLQFARFCE